MSVLSSGRSTDELDADAADFDPGAAGSDEEDDEATLDLEDEAAAANGENVREEVDALMARNAPPHLPVSVRRESRLHARYR